jgi:hypothetical protein
MNRKLLLRLSLTGTAAVLLLLALAYWWQGNLVHEIAGTLMFALLVGHNLINRRWYGTLARPRPPLRTIVTIVSNLSLLATMLFLLVTSVLASQSLFAFLPLPSFSVRELHVLAAFWVLVIFAVHLGLHWPIVMGAVRGVLGIKGTSAARTWTLRAVTAAIAAYGVHSSFVMMMGSKLLNRPTLDMWDFSQAAQQFFAHYGSIVGLYAALAHYTAITINQHREPQRTRRDANKIR